MNLTPVESLPERRMRKDLQQMIMDFVESDLEVVRVDYTDSDYKSQKVCYGCLHTAAKRSGFSIRVCIRNGQIYIIKDLKS